MVGFGAIKTPGLTCANELGTLAASYLEKHLANYRNPYKNPVSVFKGSFEPADINKGTAQSVSSLRSSHKDESLDERLTDHIAHRLICRCREITEDQIVQAIHENPGAKTVDGIKRRLGATSGRCQGSYCTQKILRHCSSLYRKLLQHPKIQALHAYFFTLCLRSIF